jgi:hypothetical protein
MDSVGLIFIGLGISFLVAILLGYQKREHMSNNKSKWESIKLSVENLLKEKYDFDIAEFRKNVADQNLFFKGFERGGELKTAVFGMIRLDIPEVKDMKDTNKAFDERYRLVDVDAASFKDFSKMRAKGDKNQKQWAMEVFVDQASKHAKTLLVNYAKMYMIGKAGEVIPKTGLSTISKIIG